MATGPIHYVQQFRLGESLGSYRLYKSAYWLPPHPFKLVLHFSNPAPFAGKIAKGCATHVSGPFTQQ